MKKIFFLIITSLIFQQYTSAQTLSGKIYDANTHAVLQGATISSNNGRSTTCGNDGSFSMNCNGVKSITISHVGYRTNAVTVKNCGDALSITLSPEARSLDAVEISATSNNNKSLLYQPASIAKLSSLELKRGNGLFLTDAINGNVPGVQMQSRGVASGQQFNIRGYGNGIRGTNGVNSNFDGQGYKVYLNGIPITDAEGITTMDDLDFASVGDVEVTKGPAGTLYGLAISGAVNLKTMRPESGKTSIGQDVLIGSYGLRRFTTHLAMGAEKSSILLNYGHQQTDGFTIHNASRKDFVNFVGDFQPNARQRISTYFGYADSYDERNGECTLDQWEARDYSGNIEYIKRDAHSAVYTFRAGVSHTYDFSRNISNTTTLFGTAFNSNASSAGGWTDKATSNFGLRSTLDTRFRVNDGISLSGISGIEIQRQNGTTIGYDMIDPQGSGRVWSIGDPYFVIGSTNTNSVNGMRSNVYTVSQTAHLFTDWTLALKKDLSISAGLGLSNMNINLNDRFYAPAIPNKIRRFDTTYKTMLAPRFAVNKVFNKKISAYFSYSSGYKAPVSSYFFIPAVGTASPSTTFNGALNNNLRPEYGTQFEIGSKGKLLNNRLTYEIALFNALFNQKMTVVAVPNPANTVTLYSYVTNGGKQNHKGVEASLRYTAYESSTGFLKSVTPFGNITYSDFKYEDFVFQTRGKTVTTPQKDSAITNDFSGYAVAGVPKIMGNLGIDITANNGLYFNFTFFHKGAMPITSNGIAKLGGQNVNYSAAAYNLLNTKIGFQKNFSGHWYADFFLGVNNIGNTPYPQQVFINQLPDAFTVGPVEALVFGGASIKYNF